MIDHVSIGVSDLGKARDFYDRVLKTLGQVRVLDIDLPGQGMVAHGYGAPGKAASFWIGVPDYINAEANRRGGVHVAFTAGNRAAVDAFHEAALAAGGLDNGKPGLRPHYHADYYGAFAFDRDGNKIEAVCRQRES